MKRAITIILTIGAVFCLISQSFAARYREQNLSRRDRGRQAGSTRIRSRIKDVNSLIKDLPFLKDPNTITTKVNEFEGLQARIDDVPSGRDPAADLDSTVRRLAAPYRSRRRCR